MMQFFGLIVSKLILVVQLRKIYEIKHRLFKQNYYTPVYTNLWVLLAKILGEEFL